MDTGNLFGHIGERKGRPFAVIRQGGQFPVLLETFLVYLDKILLYHTAHCIIICAKIQTIRQIHNR